MRWVLKGTGYAAMVLGFSGLLAPAALGHAGGFHDAWHVGTGTLAVMFARGARLPWARLLAVSLGAVYLVLGAAGVDGGAPGAPLGFPQLTDPELLRVSPG